MLATILAATTNTCQQSYCMGKLPEQLKFRQYILESVDLREQELISPVKHQTWFCNSSWAFVLTGVFEAMMTRNSTNVPAALKTADEFPDISELFYMENDYGASDFCQTGDFVTGAYWIMKRGVPMLLETKLEYSSVITSKLAAELRRDNWLVRRKDEQPFQNTNNVSFFPALTVPVTVGEGDTTTPVISLSYSKVPDVYSVTVIDKIKHLISMGVPVPVWMDLATTLYNQTYLLNQNFMDYVTPTTGKPLIQYGLCPEQPKFNHQALIVGYGWKHNVMVWIVKNSFGEYWGDNGYFFAQIGKNSFCMEMNQAVLLPANIQLDQPYITIDRTKVKREEAYELDSDHCQFYEYKASAQICYESCPPWAPFSNEQRCYGSCTSGFYSNKTYYDLQYKNIKYMSCQQVTVCPRKFWVRKMEIPNQNSAIAGTNITITECFDLDKCPSWAPYWSDKQCFVSCPVDYIRATLECTTERQSCSGSQYLFNNVCVNTCPPEAPYIEGVYCRAACVDTKFYVANLTCVELCPRETGWRLENATSKLILCLDKCPDSSKFFVTRGNCLQSCPAQYAFISPEFQCLPACYTYGDATCKASCPNAAPIADSNGACQPCKYITKQNQRVCVARCPRGYRLVRQDCIVKQIPPETIVGSVFAAIILVAAIVGVTWLVSMRIKRKHTGYKTVKQKQRELETWRSQARLEMIKQKTRSNLSLI